MNLGPATELLRAAGVTREQNGAAVLACGAVTEAWQANHIGSSGVTAFALSQAVTARLNRDVARAEVLADSVITTVTRSLATCARDTLQWHALEAARLMAEWVLRPNGDTLMQTIAHALTSFGQSQQAMAGLMEGVRKSRRMRNPIQGGKAS